MLALIGHFGFRGIFFLLIIRAYHKCLRRDNGPSGAKAKHASTRDYENLIIIRIIIKYIILKIIKKHIIPVSPEPESRGQKQCSC